MRVEIVTHSTCIRTYVTDKFGSVADARDAFMDSDDEVDPKVFEMLDIDEDGEELISWKEVTT